MTRGPASFIPAVLLALLVGPLTSLLHRRRPPRAHYLPHCPVRRVLPVRPAYDHGKNPSPVCCDGSNPETPFEGHFLDRKSCTTVWSPNP